jgi:formylglycine-generating enzyme required for sulfatase activity
MAAPNPRLAELSEDDRRVLESWLIEFDQRWSEGLLALRAAQIPPGSRWRLPALAEMVKIDLERQWQEGRRVRLESYLRHFPELGGTGGVSADLIQAEYEICHQFGAPAALDDYARRFPRRAAELGRRIAEGRSALSRRSRASPPPPLPSQGPAAEEPTERIAVPGIEEPTERIAAPGIEEPTERVFDRSGFSSAPAGQPFEPWSESRASSPTSPGPAPAPGPVASAPTVPGPRGLPWTWFVAGAGLGLGVLLICVIATVIVRPGGRGDSGAFDRPDPVDTTTGRPENPPRPAPKPEPEAGGNSAAPAKVLVNTLGMTLVLIPAGEFHMGSPGSDPDAEEDEKPQHRVRITRPFYLGTCEVTQGQFWTLMRTNPSKFKGLDDRPVECVSWNDAAGFCNTLSKREGLTPYYSFGAEVAPGGDGYRLPTEAEWEYACRAGSTTRYSFGDDAAMLNEYAWHRANSHGRTHPVGQKPPNAWGLHDMLGNVREWCGDWYDENHYRESPAADPVGPALAAVRVNRGGGWAALPATDRSANRTGNGPLRRFDALGFRVARNRPGP